MDIHILHIILGIMLFFLINWIGKHSYSLGYIEISVFVKNEEAPALNFLIRVLTPVVFIIIISAILYYLKLDKYVHYIFLVNLYYIIFRIIFNFVTHSTLLINWYRQFLYWISIMAISIVVYFELINVKANILPDFTTLANELWIIILLFLFYLANNIKMSPQLGVQRKNNYIKSRYKKFKKLFGKTITNIAKNDILESIAYAILIYEDFNRPKIVRLIENLKYRLTKKSHTLGVMQVKSDKLINDKESVILGTQKIVSAYKNFCEKKKDNDEEFEDEMIFNQIISDYNVGESYNEEVADLATQIKKYFYSNSVDTLQLKNKLPTT